MTLQSTFEGHSPRYAKARPQATTGARGPLGLVAGWRAFRLYSELSALSDGELAERGLRRSQLARTAAVLSGLIPG